MINGDKNVFYIYYYLHQRWNSEAKVTKIYWKNEKDHLLQTLSCTIIVLLKKTHKSTACRTILIN